MILYRNPATGEWFDRLPPGARDWNPHEATNLCDFESAMGDEHEPQVRDRLGDRPEQMDGRGSKAHGYRQLSKRWQSRSERRRAKRNPECAPGYRTHRGWEI